MADTGLTASGDLCAGADVAPRPTENNSANSRPQHCGEVRGNCAERGMEGNSSGAAQSLDLNQGDPERMGLPVRTCRHARKDTRMSSSFVLASTDVDEFRAAVRPVNSVMTITGRGQFSASVTRIEVHNLWMQRSGEHLPRAWEVAIPATRTAILFGTEPGPAIGWRGAEIADNEVIPAHPGTSGWHTLSGTANWGSMSLPNPRLAEASIALLGRDVTPSRDAVALAVPPLALERLRRLHAAAGRLAETAPEIIDNPDAARGLEQALTEAMIACLDATGVREDTAARRRHAAIIRRFLALTDAPADQPHYLPEICKAIGVNERTLHLCCQEQFGVSPIRYLLLRRLQPARQALGAADPSTGSVTAIATQYGFWELGRFAAYYRRAFGESPSTTLNAGRRSDSGRHFAETA